MDDSFNLADLECVGIKREIHFLVNPVVLQCGHFMCFTCVNNEKTKKDIDDIVKCGVCREDRTVNFIQNPATNLMNKQIKEYLRKLFDVVEEKCQSILVNLKNTYLERKESIELGFEYVKEEIEIRGESLKNEIDELCKTIYSDLEVRKDQYLRKVDSIYQDACNYEKELETNDDLKYMEKKTVNLANLQEKLNILKQLNQTLLDDDDNKIRSTTTERFIDMELITYLDYNNKYKNRLFIPSTFKKVIPIDVRGLYLCVMPEDQLMVSDYKNKCIIVFDKDIKPVKSVKEINGSSFEPFATATNGIDRIFISDNQINKILMTDLEFKLMNTFGSNDLIDPHGLCYSNNLIYLCDYNGKSIHVIEQDFTNRTSYQLDFAPWYIQVIDNVACIRHCDETCISFYILPEFNLKYRYEGHNGFIFIADSKFYEFYQPIPTIHCYNSDGTICFKKEIALPDKKVLDIYDPFIYFKDKFVLSSRNSNELIIS